MESNDSPEIAGRGGGGWGGGGGGGHQKSPASLQTFVSNKNPSAGLKW